jgi:hypothetical protein
MSTELNIDEVNRILADLDRDDREGTHVAEVAEVSKGTWAPEYGGGGYTSVDLLLTTARGVKFNTRFNDDIPTLAEYEAQKGTMGLGKMKGLGNSLRCRMNLLSMYQVADPAKLTRGFKLGVVIVKDKQGFPRLANVVPLADAVAKHAGGAVAAQGKDDIPF